MKEELQNMLSQYLGELMHKDENTFDWIEKEAITEKINAVNVLLGIKEKRKTFMEIVHEAIQDRKQINSK